MRGRRIAAIAAVALMACGGFVHPFGNPRAEPARAPGTLLHDADMPASARQVLITKCADCHSSATRWPVYAHVAPASWLVERDIVTARRHLDLSQWEQFSRDQRDVLIAKILQQVKSGGMPPAQYRVLHWSATISASDLKALQMLNKSSEEGDTTSAAAGDSARGKLLFERRCTGCHALGADREGPRLAGVYGRRAGSVPGFGYSNGVKNLQITWDDATLERWLTDPDAMVPDNQMSIRVPKAQDRRDLIAFLKSVSN